MNRGKWWLTLLGLSAIMEEKVQRDGVTCTQADKKFGFQKVKKRRKRERLSKRINRK